MSLAVKFTCCLIASLGLLWSIEVQADVELDPCRQLPNILEATEEARGLSTIRPFQCRSVTEVMFQSLLLEQLRRDMEPPRHHAEGRLFELLGILPENFPYLSCIESLYLQQTVAFYRPQAEDFIIPTWQPFSRSTLVHELTHALQHQAFDLERFLPIKLLTSDEILARLAVAEGDAVVTEEIFAQGQSQSDLPEPSTQSRAQLQWKMIAQSAFHDTVPIESKAIADSTECNLPKAYTQLLRFPYDTGSQFIRTMRTRGGAEAVNAVFRDPPKTTTEILHPELYRQMKQLAEGRTTNLERDVVHCTAPCRRTFFDRIGEFGVRVYLGTFLDEAKAAESARGWKDDWIELWESEQERTFIWRIQMTSPDHAAKLNRAWGEALKALPAQKRVVPRPSSWSVRSQDKKKTLQGFLKDNTLILQGTLQLD